MRQIFNNIHKNNMNLTGVIEVIGNLINMLTPLVVALALLFFFWGLATFILAAGDDNGKKKGKAIMVWGVIALFIMVSVWGIINVVRDTFQLQNTQINIPTVDVQGGGTR